MIKTGLKLCQLKHVKLGNNNSNNNNNNNNNNNSILYRQISEQT